MRKVVVLRKTINGQTVSFLYDGPQAIAELLRQRNRRNISHRVAD